jgi:hypothetical protein
MTVGPQALEHVERLRVEPVGERIVHQERRRRQQARIPRILHPIALQRAEVVGIAELRPEPLEDRPVALLALRPDLAGEEALQVGGDAVVVEERVVDVDQEYDRTLRHRHGAPPSTSTRPSG